jgi:uncharacterized membrane protein
LKLNCFSLIEKAGVHHDFFVVRQCLSFVVHIFLQNARLNETERRTTAVREKDGNAFEREKVEVEVEQHVCSMYTHRSN